MQKFYAYRSIWLGGGKKISMSMHRQILGLEPGQKVLGDHENGNTLDNRRSNLRPATRTQNAANSRMSTNNSSGQKGTYFDRGRKAKPWVAHITVNRTKIILGYYETQSEAAEAYRVAAELHFGEFARTS